MVEKKKLSPILLKSLKEEVKVLSKDKLSRKRNLLNREQMQDMEMQQLNKKQIKSKLLKKMNLYLKQ